MGSSPFIVSTELQDEMTSKLAALPPGSRRAHEESRRLAQVYLERSAVAEEIQAQVLANLGVEVLPAGEFIRQQVEARADFLLNASFAAQRPCDIKADVLKTLFVGWHYPEFPLAIVHGTQNNVLTLIARQAQWMDEFEATGCLFDFRTSKSLLPLARRFAAGQGVFAMMDYCYEDTGWVPARLLGQMVKVPAGVLKLACRFDYRIAFYSLRGDSICEVDSFEAKEAGIDGSAQRINDTLEQEILRAPARWLLWGNHPVRLAPA